MLRYIPDGYEDYSEIVHEGKWAINIWKEKLLALSVLYIPKEYTNK